MCYVERRLGHQSPYNHSESTGRVFHPCHLFYASASLGTLSKYHGLPSHVGTAHMIVAGSSQGQNTHRNSWEVCSGLPVEKIHTKMSGSITDSHYRLKYHFCIPLIQEANDKNHSERRGHLASGMLAVRFQWMYLFFKYLKPPQKSSNMPPKMWIVMQDNMSTENNLSWL